MVKATPARGADVPVLRKILKILEEINEKI
jgi:hypothetical protein